MEITIADRDDVSVVKPGGSRLDAEVAPAFRAALVRLVDRGRSNLIVDLSDIEFIDSSGLGALVSALKRLKQRDPAGDIRLAQVQPSVRAVLEIIRLHRVFAQYASVDDAIQRSVA